MKTITYDPDNLTDFDKEWQLHKRTNEWWYCTGVLDTEDGQTFGYQFTLMHIGKLPLVKPMILMLALTDMQTGEHHYSQTVSIIGRNVDLTQESIQFGDKATVTRAGNNMTMQLKHSKFTVDLDLDYGKGPVWHCDEGKLYMGKEGDEKNTTYYFSYPNMPTRGTLTVGDKTHKVTGKTWFDKQGGSYELFSSKCHWEWFSLRFDDNEEMMLFTFPHRPYYDGTYIKKDSSYERLNDYTIKTTKTVEHAGNEWSAGWDVTIPGKKDEHYTITPKFDGNINFAYFEELCSIKNDAGKEVGVCFVELLPGVRNQQPSVSFSNLFKNIEY